MIQKIIQYFNHKNLRDQKYHFLFDPYKGNEYVCFDCETTGLNPKTDEIISIGAVIIRDNVIVTSKKFTILIRPPEDKLDGTSIKIHRIRNCDLEDARSADEIIPLFLEFVQNRPLVGYYLEFDIAMINKYTKRYFGITLPNKNIEVSALYYDKYIGRIPQGNIDLRFDSIMSKLDLPFMGKHDSLNDAIMTAMIFIKLRS